MKHAPCRFHVTSLAASVVAALGLPACAPVALDTEQFMIAAPCQGVDCGQNAARLNGFPLRELNTAGLPNEDGFRIDEFSKDGQSYTLDVQNGQLVGRDAQSNVALSGAGVVGSMLKISNGTDHWELTFQEYKNDLQYWAGPPSSSLGISAYRVRYRELGGQVWEDFCPDPLSVSQDSGWLAPRGYEKFIFLIEGERYDPDLITVRHDAPTENWVTIPCAGLALAKMKLMRYDPGIPPGDPYHTKWQERQATLKMITSDVCGIGHPFTVTGQPLRWASNNGWHSVNAGDVSSDEAVWTENGAICLDTPRLSNHPEIPDILSKIQDTCGVLPSCSDPAMINWKAQGTWKTYNPL